MTMTPERLAELDAVMAKATAGEWQADGLDIKLADAKKTSWGKNEANNVAAIVALHNAYPDLKALIDAQAATIAGLREVLQPLSLFTIPSESSDGDVLADSNCGLEANFITVSDVRKARAVLTGAT